MTGTKSAFDPWEYPGTLSFLSAGRERASTRLFNLSYIFDSEFIVLNNLDCLNHHLKAILVFIHGPCILLLDMFVDESQKTSANKLQKKNLMFLLDRKLSSQETQSLI